MQFEREIRYLVLLFCIGFFVIGLSTSYWAIVGPENLLSRNDNPRLIEREAQIRRGTIYDSQERILAQSIMREDGRLTRVYPYPQGGSAVGYFSLRYGTSGAENAYNSILRGDTIPKSFLTQIKQDVLHQPQVGFDIQLTLDIIIQDKLLQIMRGRQGAIVVLDASDGALIAMISLPTYDPNLLDSNWDMLIKTEGNPFFNRALQGAYQPGGFWQTALMSEAILAQYPLKDEINNATQTVQLKDLTLHCAQTPPKNSLTLEEAYTYGCPYPFTQLIEPLGEQAILSALERFQLSNYTLEDYVVDRSISPGVVTQTPTFTRVENIVEKILGQAEETITPLAMAMIAAAVINNGNAPQPYALLSTRTTSDGWEVESSDRPAIPLMTIETAEKLQELMMQNISPTPAEVNMGGHAAYAYAGDKAHAIFIGWGYYKDKQIAVAIVLENTDNAAEILQIGQRVIEVAIR